MFLIIPAILGFLLLMHRPQVWLAVLIFVLAPFFLGLAVTAYEVLLPDCVLPRQRGTVNGVNRALGYVGGMGFLVLAFMFWEEAPWAIFLLVAVGLGVGLGPGALLAVALGQVAVEGLHLRRGVG